MTEIIFVFIGLYATMTQTIQMSILKLDKNATNSQNYRAKNCNQ